MRRRDSPPNAVAEERQAKFHTVMRGCHAQSPQTTQPGRGNASHVDRILLSEKQGELPVQIPRLRESQALRGNRKSPVKPQTGAFDPRRHRTRNFAAMHNVARVL